MIDVQGKAIAGLYCAGESAGGFALHGLPRVIVFGRIAGREAALAKGLTSRPAKRLGDLEIHVAVAVDLLTKLDINLRKRNMMFLVVAILPVELVAFDLISVRRLNGVIAKSNQVELPRCALIG